MFLLHVLRLYGSDPFDECSALETKRPTPANTSHTIVSAASMCVEITPSIEEAAELELCLAPAKSIHHFNCRYLVCIDALPVEIELSPEEEEFLAHLV